MVTIKDVAKKANMSIAAVSYALNNKKGISEETREKVLKIADELGYTPNSLARGLLFKRTDIIGLVLPNITNMYNAAVLQAIEECAQKNDFYLLIGSTGNDSSREIEVVRKLIAKNVDALIICPANYDIETFKTINEEVSKRNIPIVFFNMDMSEIKCPYVAADLLDGEYKLTKILLEKGYRDLIFVGGEISHYYSNVRFNGFQKAMQEYGLSIEENRNHVYIGKDVINILSFETGYDIVHRILSERTLPDAFVVSSDIIAFGMIKGLEDKGYQVPEDVSIVGFDHIEFPTLSRHKLVTSEIPVKKMVKKCFEIKFRSARKNRGNIRLFQIFIAKRNFSQNRRFFDFTYKP